MRNISLFASLVFLVACLSPYSQGKVLYETQCASCHMDDGSGLAGVIPPLREADYLTLFPDQLPCIILNGFSGPVVVNGKTYNQPMAAIKNLNDVEIANILNYIQYEWGDKSIFYSPEKIRSILDTCN